MKFYTWCWVFVIALNVLSVLERFFLNLFPMGVGVGVPTVQEHVSLTIFNIIMRTTARMCIVNTCLSFMTQCKVMTNWIMERFMTRQNASQVQVSFMKIHKIIGYYIMPISMLIHVWGIFLPPTVVPLLYLNLNIYLL